MLHVLNARFELDQDEAAEPTIVVALSLPLVPLLDATEPMSSTRSFC